MTIARISKSDVVKADLEGCHSWDHKAAMEQVSRLNRRLIDFSPYEPVASLRASWSFKHVAHTAVAHPTVASAGNGQTVFVQTLLGVFS